MDLKADRQDVFLPVALILVLGTMILPLSGVLLDFMLTGNITFAVLLLVSVVYLARPESFTSMPTILLLATLVRLALNISTTRYILSTGDAPGVISAFSGFVVQGNLVVGVVIFLIITAVQFIVIAKGAERVAEVSARFSLDALPGKQMAIDADLRSGVLSPVEAGIRRGELQTESRLYGSLDGAMRFVKGDAVAGLLITTVNIIAGIIVGVSAHNLGVLESAERFAFYSIGDGLVSQIPALLISVAAGIAVTRVSGQTHSFVGREMLSQLTREPQAVIVTGMVLALIGIVPGMPKMSFFFASGVLVVFGLRLRKLGELNSSKVECSIFSPQVVSGLGFKISCEGLDSLRKENQADSLIQGMRQRVFEETGVLVPNPQILSEKLDNELVAEIAIAGCAPLSLTKSDDYKDGFSQWLAVQCEDYLRENLPALIDDNSTRMLFDIHATVSESMVNSLVPEQISVTSLTRLLRELVTEGVSIRNLQCILQAVSEYSYLSGGATGQNTAMPKYEIPSLVEWVRCSLKAEICSGLDESWGAAYFSKALEDRFDSLATVPDSQLEGIQGWMLSELKSLEESRVKVILCSSKLRTWLAVTFGTIFPELRFVSFEELLPEFRFKKMHEVQFGVR